MGESTVASGIPSVMTAVQQNSYGTPRDGLTLRSDVAVPRKLSGSQILVRVYAAAMNPINWKILEGHFSLVIRLSFPCIPGGDVAGIIVDVGPAVKRLRIGDKVLGMVGFKTNGSFAEYVYGEESMFALKPNNINMLEASGITGSCQTSYQVLFQKASPPIGSGSKVFICGGSSATGLYAIQMAKAVGAHVATTCSQRNFSLMEKLGYKIVQTKDEITNDPQQLLVIDYNSKDFGQELKGEDYDLVYDCAGGEQQWLSARQILKHGGQFITIAGDNPNGSLTLKAIASTGSTLLSRKLQSVFNSTRHAYIFFTLNVNYQDLDAIRTTFVETNKVKTIIDTVFDWRKDGIEAVYAMYNKSKDGKAQGKLMLKIADEE